MQFHMCFTGQTGPWAGKNHSFYSNFWRVPRGPREGPKRPPRGLLAAMPPRGPQDREWDFGPDRSWAAAPKRPPRGHREATKRPQEAPKSSHMLTHMPARPLADMYTRVRTCSHTFTHVHTRSHMLTYVHTCPNVFTHVHTCAHMLTHVHTCSTWKRASRSCSHRFQEIFIFSVFYNGF